MSNARQLILSWAERGEISPSDLPRALALVGVLPSAQGWQRFLDRLFLWMGTLLVGSGVIFFLAYNWADLSRFGKFLLVETLLVAALLLVWRLGLDRAGGKAALFGASLLLGALLALIGQTYQTGADTFELFAAWAAMILPWALAARSGALWLLWLALVNLAATLYFQTFPGLRGVVFDTERLLWILVGINTTALAVWEVAARGREASGRWGQRLLATASGTLVTALAIVQLLDSGTASGWAIPAWFAWLLAARVVYRRHLPDVYILAGGVLSVIVVVATFLGKHLAAQDPTGFLLVGLVVIGLSAAGGRWLRGVATEGAQ